MRTKSQFGWLNPFTTDPVKALHFAMVKSTIFIFWHSDTLWPSEHRQSTRMSKIKNSVY